MLTRVFPMGLLIVFALALVIGCADNPTSPNGHGVASAPGGADGPVTEEQAIQIALGQVSGEVIEIESEVENGVDMFGVEIKTNSGAVKEVEIDANTGEVLNIEDEDDDDDDKKFLGIF